ncbi:MAG TPA: YdcF family protein [Bryobacteraceae bacterium]|nr:YdcF family protein [Bryobacteraceae bacterium]
MWTLLVVLAIAAAVWIFSIPILRGTGSLLESDGPPVKAGAIVVLAGDGEGNRILKGAELGRQGYAPVVIASNGGKRYARTESALAIEFAVAHGYPASLFLETNWKATSTLEEARHDIALLRARGVHKVLVVTSIWHTARASRIYHRLAPDLDVHLVGVNDPDWDHGNWWRTREGKKIFLTEFVKNIANYLNI